MEKIKYQINEQGVALIVMDDGKANAMNPDFFKQMMEALDQAEKDNAITIVFTGREGIFSGGLDLGHLLSLDQNGLVEFIESFARCMMRIFTISIPTIAVCNGHTIAGGVMMALSCDQRFIFKGDYKIQMNETINGIPMPRWMLLIGQSTVAPQWVSELMLLAHTYTPEEAKSKGIFTEIVEPSEDVLSLVTAQLEEIAKLNANAYKETKRRMRDLDAIERSIEELKKEFS